MKRHWVFLRHTWFSARERPPKIRNNVLLHGRKMKQPWHKSKAWRGKKKKKVGEKNSKERRARRAAILLGRCEGPKQKKHSVQMDKVHIAFNLLEQQNFLLERLWIQTRWHFWVCVSAGVLIFNFKKEQNFLTNLPVKVPPELLLDALKSIHPTLFDLLNQIQQYPTNIRHNYLSVCKNVYVTCICSAFTFWMRH